MNRKPQPGERVKFIRKESPLYGKWGIVIPNEALSLELQRQYGAIFTYRPISSCVCVKFAGTRKPFYNCNILNLTSPFDQLTEGT